MNLCVTGGVVEEDSYIYLYTLPYLVWEKEFYIVILTIKKLIISIGFPIPFILHFFHIVLG